MEILISALVGFLLEKLMRMAHRQWETWRLSHVFPIQGLFQHRPLMVRPSIEIQSGGGDPPSKRAYTHSGETEALQALHEAFDVTPISIELDYSENLKNTDHGWVFLGLSRTKSKLDKKIIEEISLNTGMELVKPSKGHMFFRDTHSGMEYHCEHIPDDKFGTRVSVDYGLIYRGVTDNGVQFLLCGGIHMHATRAAIEVACSKEFVNRVKAACSLMGRLQRKRCYGFFQLVQAVVSDDGIGISAKQTRWKDFGLIPFRKSHRY